LKTDLKRSPGSYLGKRIPDRRDSKCKGPEVGMCSARTKDRKEASEAGLRDRGNSSGK
jgi:hypothetical protein